jgi:hypothetical protein
MPKNKREPRFVIDPMFYEDEPAKAKRWDNRTSGKRFNNLLNQGGDPNKALLAAILWRAIIDYSESRYELDDYSVFNSRAFFNCRECVPFSFLWICEHLEIEPTALKDAVLAKKIKGK